MPDLKRSDQLSELDLEGAGVGAVIWCTGFEADWSWVKVDVFDDNGRPVHEDGITSEPGLYFIGLPWLSKRKSGLLLALRTRPTPGEVVQP